MHAGIESIDSMDGLVAALQRLRVEAGNPSYGEVAQRIGRMRAARGLPEQVAAPSKSTVYEAFKLGRIRIDAQLVEDIAAALGLVGAEPKAWRDTARRISNSGPLHLPEIDELTELSTNERLIGRTEEIAVVRSALQTAQSVEIVGLPGMGKSALARAAAGAVMSDHDEVLWVSLRGHSASTEPVDPQALMRALLDRWEHPYEQGRLSEEVARRLATRRTLLVLDDAGSHAQVAPFIPAAESGSRVIVTTRRPLSLPAALQLGPLRAEDSLALLGAASGEPGAAELVESCGGIPLALEIVVGRMEARPDWSMLDHARTVDQKPHETLDPLLRRMRYSHATLPADLQTALALLAHQPASHGDVEEARWLLGNSDPAEVLRRLATTGLLRLRDDGVWSMHDLVRTYAVTTSHDHVAPSQLATALQRYTTSLIGETASVLRALDVIPLHMLPWIDEVELREVDSTKGQQWLDSHLAAVYSTAAKSAEGRDLVSASRFAALMHYLALVAGDPEAALELQRITRTLAEQQGDRWEQLLALSREGALQVFRLGNASEGLLMLKWSEDLCMSMIDRPGAVRMLASIKNSQAAASTFAGDLAGAERAFRELLPHVQRDDPRLEFPILANLVEVLTRAGKVDDAVEMGLDAVERATAAGYEREMLAIGMNSLDALITSGQLDEAERIGRLSAEVAVKLQHQVQLGFLSNSLCLLALRTDRMDEARAHHAKAWEMAKQTAHRELTAFTVETEARVFLADGDSSAATAAAERAVELASASSDHGRLLSAEELLEELQSQID
ncbi:MAG: NB-ARC domain-containing protein [Agrococcus casei]